MIWTAERACQLARHNCPACRGTGLPAPPAGVADEQLVPCSCVCRRVFRACYARFRTCAAADGYARTVTFREMPRGVDRRLVWIRSNEDYCADFQAAARRALPPELHRIFRFHYVLGAPVGLIAKRLRVSRSLIYCFVSEIEPLVGLEFALMQPYSLYPPKQYMQGSRLAERENSSNWKQGNYELSGA